MIQRLPFPNLVDLHVHSSASDGVLSPRAVVHHAVQVGLKAVALTDHDTVAGVAEAVEAGREFGVEVVPGVEISTEYEGGACHMLGYFIDPASEPLLEVLAVAQEGRARRNRKILARLRELGFDLTLEDVEQEAGGTSVTRAHFARALLDAGHVRTWDEAFDKYLGRGKPAYVYRRRVEPGEAIGAIHAAGGAAVLAHPRQLKRNPVETDEWIEHLAEAGLDGVEIHTPDHDAALGRRYAETARRLDLIETGGTDWHGREDSDLRLGMGDGSVQVGYEVVERLAGRAERWAAEVAEG